MSVYTESVPSVHGKMAGIGEIKKPPPSDDPPKYTPRAAPPGDFRDFYPQPITASSYLALAVLACILFFPFGLIALVFSLRSRSAARDGKMEVARDRGKLSLAISLTAIFTCFVVIAIILGIYFTHGSDFIRCGSPISAAQVCTPSSDNYNVYQCGQMTSPTDACNIASRSFNYYQCFDIVHVCNPTAMIYNRAKCDEMTTPDACNPSSSTFDLIECAAISLEHECNPFSSSYDPDACKLIDDPACDPISTSFDMLACVSDGIFDDGVCNYFSSSFDALLCIGEAVPSDSIPEPCNPLSEQYDAASCLSDTVGMDEVPAACNPLDSTGFDLTSCLGESFNTGTDECNPVSDTFSLRDCLQNTGSLTGVSSVCDPLSTSYDFSACIGTDLNINIDLSSPACTPGSPDFNIFACLANEGEAGVLPPVCNLLSSSYDVVACAELYNPDDACNPLSPNYDPDTCETGLGGPCDPTSSDFDLMECTGQSDMSVCNPLSSSFDMTACIGRMSG